MQPTALNTLQFGQNRFAIQFGSYAINQYAWVQFNAPHCRAIQLPAPAPFTSILPIPTRTRTRTLCELSFNFCK